MNDTEAIEKCRNGEREAFRFLVERYQKQAVAHSTAILATVKTLWTQRRKRLLTLFKYSDVSIRRGGFIPGLTFYFAIAVSK